MTDLPKTMNAMVLTGHGDVDMLVWHEDWPRPEPGPGQVLIRVTACGLNNSDVNTRTAWYATEVKEGISEKGGVGLRLPAPCPLGTDPKGLGIAPDPDALGQPVAIID